MPMIDVYIPERALEAKAEARLMEELTEILIRHEGMDPANERIRAVTWIFLHRPKVFRAGAPAVKPCYRIVPSVPEGQYTEEARASLVKDVAEAVTRAEGGTFEEVSARVWVFPTEVFDGGWGSRGAIQRLPDIMHHFGGEPLRQLGIQRLAAKRARDVAQVFGSLVQVFGTTLGTVKRDI